MNTIFYWITQFFTLRNYTLRNFAVFLLVLFCIQYIPVESRAGVSWVKVAVMAVTPLVLLKYMVVNKAVVIALLYTMWILITSYLLHPATFRYSTVIYLYMFVVTFVAFYTFVWSHHVFSLGYFDNIAQRIPPVALQWIPPNCVVKGAAFAVQTAPKTDGIFTVS